MDEAKLLRNALEILRLGDSKSILNGNSVGILDF